MNNGSSFLQWRELCETMFEDKLGFEIVRCQLWKSDYSRQLPIILFEIEI